MSCHCGSGKSFKDCCEPFIKQNQNPQTAEQLMRSRYSAYVTGDIDYIEQTQLEDGEAFDKEAAKSWSESSDWKGLEIVSTQKGRAGDSDGIVEFVAHYSDESGEHSHHEISSFIFDKKWIYKSGFIPGVSPITRAAPKVGRNDPCPCGSGKKFKKCCG
jgi:SEC-C motif-containing protein